MPSKSKEQIQLIQNELPRRQRRTALPLGWLALSALSLAGCASTEGAQRPVIGVQGTTKLAQDHDLATALTNFGSDDNSSRGGLSKQAYRDLIVGIYMNAIDARYRQFTTNLSSESKRTGLGLDLAVIGLTGWASVAKHTIVNEISAVAGGFAGARGAIDKNLYFDQTLPALIAAMDAEHLKVGSEILRNLQRNATEYPLVVAIGDLNRYELAGSLNAAIQTVTSQASQKREEAKAEYENAVKACDSPEDLQANRTTIMKWVVARKNESPPNSAALKGLLDKMALSVPDNPDAAAYAAAARTAIQNDILENYCSNAKLAGLITTARGTDWGSAM